MRVCVCVCVCVCEGVCVCWLQVQSRSEAHTELNNLRRKPGSALVISGSSLEVSEVS